MGKTWIEVKVDERNGEVVLFDVSLPNQFLKTEEDYEKFFEVCMEFKKQLEAIKRK